MIYNIPPFPGIKLAPEIIFRISEIDGVIGYKDTSGSFPDFQRCLSYFKDTDFILHQGATNLAAASLLLGADGYIPSMAPLFPEAHIKLYESACQGDIEKTMYYNNLLYEINNVFKMTKHQTSATKYAISLLGFFDKRSIRPTEPTLPHEEKAIEEKIKKL